ncbi:ABC transporter ATP-binding protein [Mangrovibacillus cuniculi]|uniref:ABC transporter ATP-binding protein n=1 Tax=Mangrovibacillus cuniculi TaxID=2593652 RepID=A0A7S8C9K9_9BACI|nr:ABC transporter ATP-binding protein [Mangrovibacillus cuniculi]QPC45946.1 ABC transporter ATP-binding protein [Mangrovibacillus cuniculi]
MLRVDSISFSFSKKEILHDITFTAEKDKVTCIVGPSGSGKSTLFEIIGGLLSPNSGDVLLEGASIVGEKGNIAFMPQESTLFPWRTIMQNITLPMELSGTPINEKDILGYLRRAGLEEYAFAFPNQLSGGMKQRVSFIRALVSNIPLLLLDEPFSALDEFTRRDMQNWLLKTIKDSPRTILFVTHQIEEALLMADKIIVLSNNPATVLNEIVLPNKEQREEDWTFSPEAQAFKKEIINLLKPSS